MRHSTLPASNAQAMVHDASLMHTTTAYPPYGLTTVYAPYGLTNSFVQLFPSLY